MAGAQPGQRIAVLALVPIAAVGIIWWLGARSWRLPEDASAKAEPGDLGADRLDAPEFWDNQIFLRRLRALHVAIALGTVDVVLLGVVAPHDHQAAGYALLAAVVGLVAAAALLCRPAWPGHPGDRRIGAACRAARAIMLSLTALTLGDAALPRSRWTPEAELPGYDSLVAGLYMGQMALLLILGAVVVLQRRRTGISAFLGGLGAPVVISFAIGLGEAFSSGLVYVASEYLHGGPSPTPTRTLLIGVPPLVPSEAYRWAALGFFVAVVAAAFAALLRYRLTLWHRRRAAMGIVRRDFPDAPPESQPRVRAVRDAITRAQITDQAGPLPAAYAIIAVLTLGSAGFALAGIGPGELSLTSHGGTVVLSGHSHGAVLVAATVLQLQPACLDRIALLTYANPLRRLYGRVFPAHLGPAALREIGDRVGWRWLNLWRDTDWIGGWVFSPVPSRAATGDPDPSNSADPANRVDRRLRDPRSLLTLPEDTVPPPIEGHRFDPDEDFQAAVRDLVTRLRAALPGNDTKRRSC